MLRNKCVKLVRRDRMQTAMKKLTEASNRQAAAWRFADSMLKRGNTERLPLLRGSKSDAECASACNEFFLQKVDNLVKSVQTSPETGVTMGKARDFIKNIANQTHSFELNCVGISATKKAIPSMGSTKAIGVDGLPCAFWKKYCDDLAPFVNLLINTSIKTGTYPISGPRAPKEGRPGRSQCYGLLKLGNAGVESKQARKPPPRSVPEHDPERKHKKQSSWED